MTTHPPIEIRAGDLKPVITGLAKVIPTKGTLPALRCVKVEAINPKTVQLTATDLDVTLRIEIPGATPQKTEPFLLPLDALRDRVKGHKAGDLICLGPIAKAIPAKEFPATPEFRATPISLQNEVATSLLRAFGSASQDPTRHVLRGAYLDTSGTGPKSHRIVATDGRQLFSSNSLHLPKIKEPVILPDHKLWQWKPITSSRPWTLRIGAAKSGITPFRIEGPFWSITGKCLEGNYPNYRQVIPPASDFKTVVDIPEEVSAAITGLIPKLPGRKLDNRPVGIRVDNGLVSLLAREANDEPWQLYPIGETSVKGPSFTTFAKRDYVERAFRFGLHQLKVSDETTPLQFSRKGDLMIVMPVRVTDADKMKALNGAKPLVHNQTRQSDPPKRSQPRSKSSAPSKKKVPTRKPATKRKPTSDPLNEAETRIAEANQALRSAGRELKSATGSLKKVRKRRSEDQEELSGFRSLLQSIKQFGKHSSN
ncbi:DNA polymerase III subunit beta [Verrucomicrobiales bacterium BCK34]|nr:DNA polymerase III subunit beta [Verrucomicrobiales bacterium BCK34]